MSRPTVPAAPCPMCANFAPRLKHLANFPEAYPLLPRYEQYGVRRRPHGNYLIFYEIIRDIVFVTHVLHGAQDYEAILFPQE